MATGSLPISVCGKTTPIRITSSNVKNRGQGSGIRDQGVLNQEPRTKNKSSSFSCRCVRGAHGTTNTRIEPRTKNQEQIVLIFLQSCAAAPHGHLIRKENQEQRAEN